MLTLKGNLPWIAGILLVLALGWALPNEWVKPPGNQIFGTLQ